MTGKIPVIDFGLISDSAGETISENSENWRALSESVLSALSQVGFIYIVNHGIPNDVINGAFLESNSFFSLPQTTKEKYMIDMTKTYRGYTRPGQQLLKNTTFHEFRECFSIEEPEENFKVAEAPELISTIENLRRQCQLPVRKLLRLIGLALQLPDEEFFLKSFNAGQMKQNCKLNSSMMRSHYYPAIPEDINIPENSIRCSEHTDFGILTFLFQDSMGGLEVKGLDNNWIPATPIPGSILVNTGDIMEFWTGGLFPATAHRVIIPEEEIQKRTKRQSIVYFVNPDSKTLVKPLDLPQFGRSNDYDTDPDSTLTFKEYYQIRLEASYKY